MKDDCKAVNVCLDRQRVRDQHGGVGVLAVDENGVGGVGVELVQFRITSQYLWGSPEFTSIILVTVLGDQS